MDHEKTLHINLFFYICVTINLIKNGNDFFFEKFISITISDKFNKMIKDNKITTTENIDQDKIIDK